VVNRFLRRKRWLSEQMLVIVKQTKEPCSSVSLFAKEHDLTATQLFQWGKTYFDGFLVAIDYNETVLPASE
jgi:transposase